MSISFAYAQAKSFSEFSAQKKKNFFQKNFEWEIKSNLLAEVVSQKYFTEHFNFYNQVLKKSDLYIQSEIQPSIDIKLKTIPIKWVSKPKLKFRRSRYNIENLETVYNISEYGFWENYIHIDLSSKLEFSIGVMNAQWGPSELLNPSQFMLNQQTLIFEPFQLNDGIELAQILWTPTQNMTMNFLTQLHSFEWNHSDEPIIYKKEYSQKNLIRIEYATNSGEFAIGQVLGQKEANKMYWQYGGYSQWNYTDWTQIYIDYLIQKGSDVLYLESDNFINTTNSDVEELFSLIDIGHRITFENGMEWKFEWIYNSFGKNKEEQSFEILALKINPMNPYALKSHYQKKYIFIGQNYFYNSLRWDNPSAFHFLFDSTTLFFRVLFSLSDQSHIFNLEFQSSLSDHWSQAVALVKASGDSDSELASELDFFGSYVLKYTF